MTDMFDVAMQAIRERDAAIARAEVAEQRVAQLEAATADSWVSVEERLPDEDTSYPWMTVDVVAWNGEEIISPACYYVKDLPTFGWKAGTWRFADKPAMGVTHWIPLPAPAKDA